MIERELIESFIGKRICFCWKVTENHQEYSYGILKAVTNSSIVVDFYGQEQVYDLSSIISIREIKEKNLRGVRDD